MAKRGRPKESETERINVYVSPNTRRKIDSMVVPDVKALSSRGKIIDLKFAEPPKPRA